MKFAVDNFVPELLHCQEITAGMPSDVASYDVRLSTPEGKPVSGCVCIPTAKGTYPIVTHFMGYGILGASPKTLDAVQGLEHSLAVPAGTEHFYKSKGV